MPEKAKNRKWLSRKGKLSDVTINTETGEVVKHFIRIYSKKKRRNQIKARGSVYHSFYRELECLKRLKGQSNFPQLIDYDEEKMWIKMTYCGEPYPAHLSENNTSLVQQTNQIVLTLNKMKILYPYQKILTHRTDITAEFPVHNLHYKDGTIYLIDFEMSLPLGSGYSDYFEEKFMKTFDNYDVNAFKQLLRKAVAPGDREQKPEHELQAKWQTYQNKTADNIDERLKIFKLDRFGGEGLSMLDIGASTGDFVKALANCFTEVTAVEPFIPKPDNLPSNVTWKSMGYNNFIKQNANQYDLVLCLRASLQIADIDMINEETIARTLSLLVNPNQFLIFETTRQVRLRVYQTHVADMLGYLKTFFGPPIETGNLGQKGGRMYYVFKKTR